MTPDTVSEAGSLKSRSRRTLPYLPPEEPAPLPTQAKKHQERMRYTKKAVIFKGNENKKRRSSYALKLENNFYFAKHAPSAWATRQRRFCVLPKPPYYPITTDPY